DLGARRRNTRVLAEAAGEAELWAVVEADAYGHGAADCARVALEAGARALCVATAKEGAALRSDNPDARILVLSPLGPGEEKLAREAGLEVAVSSPQLPEGIPLHVKVDTGMGRFGMSPDEAAEIDPGRVAGVIAHLPPCEGP